MRLTCAGAADVCIAAKNRKSFNYSHCNSAPQSHADSQQNCSRMKEPQVKRRANVLALPSRQTQKNCFMKPFSFVLVATFNVSDVCLLSLPMAV